MQIHKRGSKEATDDGLPICLHLSTKSNVSFLCVEKILAFHFIKTLSRRLCTIQCWTCSSFASMRLCRFRSMQRHFYTAGIQNLCEFGYQSCGYLWVARTYWAIWV